MASKGEKEFLEFRQKVKARYLRMFPCRRTADFYFLRFKHIDHRMSLTQREAMY